jgi:hypothetical protein
VCRWRHALFHCCLLIICIRLPWAFISDVICIFRYGPLTSRIRSHKVQQFFSDIRTPLVSHCNLHNLICFNRVDDTSLEKNPGKYDRISDSLRSPPVMRALSLSTGWHPEIDL